MSGTGLGRPRLLNHEGHQHRGGCDRLGCAHRLHSEPHNLRSEAPKTTQRPDISANATRGVLWFTRSGNCVIACDARESAALPGPGWGGTVRARQGAGPSPPVLVGPILGAVQGENCAQGGHPGRQTTGITVGQAALAALARTGGTAARSRRFRCPAQEQRQRRSAPAPEPQPTCTRRGNTSPRLWWGVRPHVPTPTGSTWPDQALGGVGVPQLAVRVGWPVTAEMPGTQTPGRPLSRWTPFADRRPAADRHPHTRRDRATGALRLWTTARLCP